MAKGIELIRGTTNHIQLQIMDAGGNYHEQAETETVFLGVKRNKEDSDPIFIKVARSQSDYGGLYEIVLEPEDTANLSSGTYWYDVGLESGENFYNIIEPSPFVIHPNITKKGDADG